MSALPYSYSEIDEDAPVPRYRSRLLAELEDEHRDLADLHAQIVRAHRRGERVRCLELLGRFRYRLVVHLQREDQELYAYLRHSLEPLAADTPHLRGLLDAMERLGQTLQRFGSDYVNDLDDAGDEGRLGRDLQRIGTILAHRIREEEAVLYPMYLPPLAE